MVVEVDEDHGAIGVLRLSRAHKTPEGGVSEVEDVLVGPDGDGAAGEEDEPARRKALVSDPGLQERERPVGFVVRRLF
jgi:hypothetical protein